MVSETSSLTVGRTFIKWHPCTRQGQYKGRRRGLGQCLVKGQSEHKDTSKCPSPHWPYITRVQRIASLVHLHHRHTHDGTKSGAARYIAYVETEVPCYTLQADHLPCDEHGELSYLKSHRQKTQDDVNASQDDLLPAAGRYLLLKALSMLVCQFLPPRSYLLKEPGSGCQTSSCGSERRFSEGSRHPGSWSRI